MTPPAYLHPAADMLLQAELSAEEVPANFGDTERYFDMLLWITLAILAIAFAILYWQLYAVWRFMRCRSTADSKQVLNNFCVCVYILGFSMSLMITMPIPTSLQLVLAHGGGTGTSGLFVSCGIFGLPAILASRFIPSVARLSWSTSLRLYIGLQIFGTALVTLVGCLGAFPGSLWCLLCGRLICGQGVGLNSMKAREHVTAAVDSDDLPTFTFRCSIAGLAGLCMGPLLGSVSVPTMRIILRNVGLGSLNLNPGAHCALCQLGWLVLIAPCFVCLSPASTHVAGVQTSDPSREMYKAAPDRVRRLNVAACLFVLLFKDTIVCSIEVFDLLVLELEYGYSVEESGFLTTLALFMALPLMVLYTLCAHRLPYTLNCLFRRCSFIVPIIASFAAYPNLCPFSGVVEAVGPLRGMDKCMIYMMVGRVLLYFFWAVGSSWIAGGYFRWAVQQKGHWCSNQNMSFYCCLAIEGFTRGIGPFLLRSLYENYGRLGACVFITYFEIMVLGIVWLGLIMPWGDFWKD